jgi:hypothetical protein
MRSVRVHVQEMDGLGGARDAEETGRESILLAACGAGEVLPQNPDLPADVFTACLTTPIKARSRAWPANERTVHPTRCVGWPPVGCLALVASATCACPLLALH